MCYIYIGREREREIPPPTPQFAYQSTDPLAKSNIIKGVAYMPKNLQDGNLVDLPLLLEKGYMGGNTCNDMMMKWMSSCISKINIA